MSLAFAGLECTGCTGNCSGLLAGMQLHTLLGCAVQAATPVACLSADTAACWLSRALPPGCIS